MKKIYFLFFIGERVGFEVLVGLRHHGAMQPIDHAMNYNRHTALGMTQLPLKGNPISSGDAWRSGTLPVVGDSYVTVLTPLYIAHSPVFNAVVFNPRYRENESPGRSDVTEAGEIYLGWGKGRQWLRSAVCCTSSCPCGLRRQLASAPASCFGPKQCTLRDKLLPTPYKTHPNSDLSAESAGRCPPAPPFAQSCPPSSSLPAHHPSPFTSSQPFCPSLPTTTPTPLSPVLHPTFWVGFPPLCRKSKGKRGGKARGLGGGTAASTVPSPVCLPPLPQAAVAKDQSIRQK